MQRKRALITGATKGLGLAIAQRFAADGTDVFLSYRSDEEAARRAVDLISKSGVRCEVLATDLSEEGSVDRLFDRVALVTDRIDFYVHNAAATAFKDLLEIKSHHIDKTLNLTVKGFILGVQRAVALMPAGGAIVSISGMDTLKAVPRHGLLGAAKAALETLTAYYAHELGSRRVRVNGVNPGFLRTDSTKKYLGAMFEPMAKGFANATPLRRDATLEEIADVVAFLCSSQSTWIVGQTLIVDGGFDFALMSESNTPRI